MTALALEASTSAVKAMLWQDGQTRVRSREYTPDMSDGASIDADRAFDAVVGCAREVLDGQKPDCLALSSVWHGLLLLDEQARPLGRCRTWAVGGEISMPDRNVREALYRETGCPAHGSFSIWKYRPDARVRWALNLGEYLFYRLTGSFFTARSYASGSGWLSLRTGEWSQDALDVCGLSRELLPVVDDTPRPLSSEAAGLLGIAAGTPVCPCMPDGGLNQIAAGGLRPGVMTLSVGTSAACRLCGDTPVLSPQAQTWCYHLSEGLFVYGGATNGAGNCVRWLVREVLGGTYRDWDECLVNANPERAPVFLPFLFGERSPGYNDTRSGGFFGLRGGHGAADLYYAVLEGVLMNLRHIHEVLGVCAERIYIAGGIVNAPVWLQMAADVFGAPLQVLEQEHASLEGAALVARKAAGELGSLSEVCPDVRDTLVPQNNRDERFKRYLAYYETGDQL